MVMESPLKMLSDVDVRQTLTLGNGLIGSNENMEDNIGREIGLLFQEQSSKEIIDRERGLNIYRSGSAPPTVEGSMTAVGSLFRHSDAHFSGINSNGNANGVLSEEEIRSHPSYLSYYYSHENLNPRLPPPLLTKEDWRIAQRFQSGTSSCGGIGDTRRKELINESNSKSLFSLQPGLPAQSGEAVLIEPRKVTPRNLNNQQPLAEWLERGTDGLIGLAGVGLGSRRKSLADMLQEGLGRPNNISAPLSRPVSHNAFDDFVDPLGASDPQLKHLRNGMESVNGLSSRATSPGLVRVQSFGSSISHSFSSVVGSSLPRSTTPEAPLVGRSPSPCLPPVGGRVSAADKKHVTASNVFNGFSSSMGDRTDIVATLSGLSLSKNGLLDEDGDVHSQLEQKFDDQTNIMFDRPNGHRKRSGNHVGSGLQEPTMDPLYIQYLARTSDYAAYLNDPSLGRNHIGTSHGDLLGFQKAYLEALIAQQKQQYGLPFIGRPGGLSHGYYESRTFGLGMPYPENPIANPIQQNERILRFPSMVSSTRGSIGSWHTGNIGNIEGSYASSLMEQFKNNRTKCFELLDIVDHVVEFSVDQYGSRFIQQKLETATVEEKNKIFPEIIPHARTLMTDVFGNYVIQKFFEHGTESQRKELASQLIGHILPLSLQMYGCRVIQKALEMVDMDEKTRMVAELDGVVMKCVRDQNGNHVIQKCIECVPENQIQFIISTFYGQVVALSTHPYGCRVIQRVLEHCNDLNTLHIIMGEILQSICTLAQDQYGNYVVQHVLQHGKPHERSAIIKKLAGQIVKMSQQKFASNVVEKCLTSGGPEERQLLVNEMLGSTNENEPLQAMMKDPYGNYVVQKVLETCDNQSRELILSRIKVHLNALTRYTYGKHVVARVEKLITTGERHIGISSSYSSRGVL